MGKILLLSSPWTVQRNRLAKFQPKTPKNLTDEVSSQHRGVMMLENSTLGDTMLANNAQLCSSLMQAGRNSSCMILN
jgi:hypothetical protein